MATEYMFAKEQEFYQVNSRVYSTLSNALRYARTKGTPRVEKIYVKKFLTNGSVAIDANRQVINFNK